MVFGTDLVRKNLKDQLETMGLPSNFTLEVVQERREVKIRYRYQAAASVFNYTYYEVKEDIEAVTQEGVWDR